MKAAARDTIAKMELLLNRARLEGRVFTEAEDAEFSALRLEALEQQMENEQRVLDAPTNPTRPIEPPVRSISEAVQKDGLFARMNQHGRARVDLPMDIRALGSDQALSPAPGMHVQPTNLGVFSTYNGIVNRLMNALAHLPVTGTNAVVYTRVTFAPPAGSPSVGGNRGAKVQELAEKPESSLATEEVTQVLDTYAHWLPCSKQILDDVTGLRALLDMTLVAGLLDKTDASIYATMTTAGNYTPYTPAGGLTTGEVLATVATSLLTLGVTNVTLGLNPMTILAMSMVKASGSGEYLGMPGNIPAQIVASASVAPGKVLAWADSATVWANREGLSVIAGLNQDDFVKNKVTLLAEHRGAVLTLNPNHVFFGNATGA